MDMLTGPSTPCSTSRRGPRASTRTPTTTTARTTPNWKRSDMDAPTSSSSSTPTATCWSRRRTSSSTRPTSTRTPCGRSTPRTTAWSGSSSRTCAWRPRSWRWPRAGGFDETDPGPGPLRRAGLRRPAGLLLGTRGPARALDDDGIAQSVLYPTMLLTFQSLRTLDVRRDAVPGLQRLAVRPLRPGRGPAPRRGDPPPPGPGARRGRRSAGWRTCPTSSACRCAPTRRWTGSRSTTRSTTRSGRRPRRSACRSASTRCPPATCPARCRACAWPAWAPRTSRSRTRRTTAPTTSSSPRPSATPST